MTQFTKEQLQHIIVLNADRLFDTQAQPGWKKEKLVEAIIEKAEMIVETTGAGLDDYRIVGQTILNYVRDIEFATKPIELGDATVSYSTVVAPGEIELNVPTHTVGLIEWNKDEQIWEAVRDVKNGETEEEFNQRRADFHKAERERRRVEVKPAATPQQHLARVFGTEK
jgi:hypothetical protein